MKLITKNLTGYLNNGDRYKICFSNENCQFLKNKKIISVFIYSFSEILDMWILENVVCNSYDFVHEYKEALRNALVNAENEFKIPLLKSKIQIVA